MRESAGAARTRSIGRGVAAGLLGGGAYLATMALDMAATQVRTNDLRLLAGLVPGGDRRRPLLGTLIHFANSGALGVVYAWAQARVPGTGWRRGVIFALVENLVLWPLLLLLDRIHPEIRAGRLPRYGQVIPFLQQVIRHVAYGAALGWAYRLLDGTSVVD